MRKYYKLLKDIPTADAGTVFYIDDTENAPALRFRENDMPLYSISSFEHFGMEDEWFEEIEAPKKRWRAAREEGYYCVHDGGDTYETRDYYSHSDDFRWETGNYFRTEREAELYKTKLITYQTVKDDAKGFCPDRGGSKFYVFYAEDGGEGELTVGRISWERWLGVFFKTKEEAQASIKKHEAEWLLLLDAIDLSEYERRKEKE